MATLDDEKRVSLQSSRVIHAKINVLDFNFNLVGEITGTVLEGSSYTIDATSDIRRTCSISVVVEDSSFDVGYGSKIWLDKYIQIFVGIEDLENNNEVVYSNIGIYLINNPKQMYDAVTNTLSINGVDLMSKITGLRNGYLEGITYQIKANSNIREAMIAIIDDECGFEQYSIDLPRPTILTPNDLSFGLGSTAFDIVAQLRDINSNYQTYFDQDGVFRFNRIPSGDNEQVMVDEDIWRQVLISYSKESNFEEVKNYIEVFGKTQQDGHTPYGVAYDNNPLSPFFIGFNNENRIRIVLSGGEYDNIYPLANYSTSQEQFNSLAQQRADYELYLRCKLQDSLEVICVPLYWLDVNWLVNIALPNKRVDGSEDEEIVEQYIIKRITTNLDVNGTQTVSLIKYYPFDIEHGLAYAGVPVELSRSMYNSAGAATDNYAIITGYNTVANAFDETLTRFEIETLARYKPLGISFNGYAFFACGWGNFGQSSASGFGQAWAYDNSLTKISLADTNFSDDAITKINKKTALTDYIFIPTYVTFLSSTTYDDNLTRGSADSPSVNRLYCSCSHVNNYAIVIGGTDDYVFYNTVEIYDDMLTHEVVPYPNIQQKMFAVGATVGDYALFVGGYYYYTVYYVNTNTYQHKMAYNTQIIAFDKNLTATLLSFSFLATERDHMSTTTIGDFAVFAGGGYYRDNIYDLNHYKPINKAWTIDKDLTATFIHNISSPRASMGAVTLGNFVLFGGGTTYGEETWEYYDTSKVKNYKSVDVYSLT